MRDKKILKYSKFLEARLSDILNIKSTTNSDIEKIISDKAKADFEFDKSLVKYVTTRSSITDKEIRFKILWNDNSKHDLQKRIKERSYFKSISEFNDFFKKSISTIFPDMIGKELFKSGRYSLYNKEHNISIIISFDLNLFIKNRYQIKIVTILPGEKGYGCVKIINI